MYPRHILLAFLVAELSVSSVRAGEGTGKVSKVPVPTPPKFHVEDASQYGLEIATYADRYDSGWVDEVSQGSMTLYDADGDSVRRSYLRKSLEFEKKGDKTVIKFLSPAEIKGVSALTHENPGSSDDNWLYLPASKRVRRISGANNTASFQGTEFTYEDLSNIDPREYKWRHLGKATVKRGTKDEPVFKLDARPTYKDTGYSRLVVYIHQTTWRQERIEYYDKAGKLLKTRNSSGWRLVHSRFWRPRIIEMTNHQTGKRTKLMTPKLFLNLSLYPSKRTGKSRKNLTESSFTTRAIQS
ncbi:MAG: outer membrane lipoprotein-sorting protein [Planctomycetota bacterium]